jgi:hypothetical protein
MVNGWSTPRRFAALQRAQASGLPACVNVMIEGLPAPLLRRPAP